MGRVNTPKLDEKAKLELKKGYESGKSHAFRKRCHLLLLKSENRKSEEVGEILKISENSVNFWVSRYKKEGIAGLKTKKGRGRKALLDPEKDRAAVLAAIKKHRQRSKSAQVEFEQETGKKVSSETFTRFLKVLAEDTKGSEKG